MEEIRVLLVDDEEEFVSTLAERLELRGFQPFVAYSGESALEAFAEKEFHVVLLDLMMPGIGGLDVLKQMKSISPDMPVILLTGHGASESGIEGMKYGAFDYLMKPVNIKELIEKMEEASGSN
jgi:DNA-binding NtrC family response regulator